MNSIAFAPLLVRLALTLGLLVMSAAATVSAAPVRQPAKIKVTTQIRLVGAEGAGVKTTARAMRPGSNGTEQSLTGVRIDMFIGKSNPAYWGSQTTNSQGTAVFSEAYVHSRNTWYHVELRSPVASTRFRVMITSAGDKIYKDGW